MIEIRPEQFDKFEQEAQKDFHHRLAAYLREEIPDEAGLMSEKELLERIAYSDRTAEKYGITSEAGIAQFACLTFYSGVDFDQIPEVQEFLTADDGIDPEEKLDQIIDELPDE